MDTASPPLFALMKARLQWLDQRQAVLARVVANADTPNYRPQDLKPFAFDVHGREELAATNPRHLRRRGDGAAADVVTSRHAYEITPSGNSVILEEQMAKVNETNLAHALTTQLYRKYASILKSVVNAKG